MRPFAVVPVLIESVRFLRSRFASFVALGGVPLILFCVVDLILERLPDPSVDPRPWVDIVIYHAVYAVDLLIPVPFYVAWHRMTMSLPVEARWGIFPRLGTREIRYGVYTLILSFLVLPLYFVPYLSPDSLADVEDQRYMAMFLLVSFIAYIGISLWITARLSFLFVGIAVDGADGLAAGWHSAKGNVGRLVVIVAAVWLTLFAVDLLEAAMVGEQVPVPPIFSIAEAVITFLASTIWVSAVTIAYREATGWMSKDIADVF